MSALVLFVTSVARLVAAVAAFAISVFDSAFRCPATDFVLIPLRVPSTFSVGIVLEP